MTASSHRISEYFLNLGDHELAVSTYSIEKLACVIHRLANDAPAFDSAAISPSNLISCNLRESKFASHARPIEVFEFFNRIDPVLPLATVCSRDAQRPHISVPVTVIGKFMVGNGSGAWLAFECGQGSKTYTTLSRYFCVAGVFAGNR